MDTHNPQESQRRLATGIRIATIVVMAWAGSRFYVGAWKSLRHGSANMNTLIAIGTGATTSATA